MWNSEMLVILETDFKYLTFPPINKYTKDREEF